MSLNDRIQKASAQSSQLLSELSGTYNDFLTFPRERDHVIQVTKQIQHQETLLKTLGAKTQKELKEWQARNNSKVSKTFSKLTHRTEKYDAATAKEEQEFQDAYHTEEDAKTRLAQLRDELQQAETVRNSTEFGAQRHQICQKEIDDLYNYVFAAPTPEHYDQEAAKANLQSANSNVDAAAHAARSEEQAHSFLLQAYNMIKQAMDSMHSADNWSTYDTMGGGSMASMAKRDKMQQSQGQVIQAQNLIMMAKQQSPEVNLGNAQLNVGAQGSGFTDVFFDNIFTDMKVADQISNSTLELRKEERACFQQMEASKQRFESKQGELLRATKARDQAKMELQSVRATIFQNVAGGY